MSETKRAYSIDEIHGALRRFIDGTFTLNVPPQETDEDLILYSAIAELEKRRAEDEEQKNYYKNHNPFYDPPTKEVKG
jgi:hypothetical protein